MKKKKEKIGTITQMDLLRVPGKINRTEQRSFVHRSEKDYGKWSRRKAKKEIKEWEDG